MKRSISLLALSLLASVTALAQDPAAADARRYKVEFENDKVRVLRVRIEPRAKTVMHAHPDAVVVALSDANVRHHLPDGKHEDRELKAGIALWTPAVNHAPENMTGKAFEVIVVELKSSASAASAARASDDAAAIMRLERDWADAVKRGDTRWMEEHYAPEYSWTSPEGAVNDRATDIAEAKHYRFDALEMSDARIRVNGDTAIVNGVSAVRGQYKGADFSGRFRFTDTLVRRDGRWMIMASQYTRVATPETSAK